jgi:hypothetical protein
MNTNTLDDPMTIINIRNAARGLFARWLTNTETEPTPAAGVPLVRRCYICHTNFEITADHAKWFSDRRLSLPRRCPGCIAQAKHDGQVARAKETLGVQ